MILKVSIFLVKGESIKDNVLFINDKKIQNTRNKNNTKPTDLP